MRVEPHPSGASPGSLAGTVCLDMLLLVGSVGGEDSRTAAREDEERWRAWMQRAQTGDRQAYTRLLDELSGVIRAFVRKTLGDVPLVDDCVQESLIAIHGVATWKREHLGAPHAQALRNTPHRSRRW